jgi:putative ABC transport system ATP-binding protein
MVADSVVADLVAVLVVAPVVLAAGPVVSVAAAVPPKVEALPVAAELEQFPTPLLQAQGLCRDYVAGEEIVHAVVDVHFQIFTGESVAIVGASGSGKSTLLHLLGLLDRPTAGRFLVGGTDTASLSDDRRAELRNRAIGFVFQSFNLVAGESALENVAAPLVYARVRRAERLARATEALRRVGLEDRMRHVPAQLSGGQRQRVAIARALVTRPRLLLADEPTGNLDSVAGTQVLSLLDELHAEGLTTVVITHEQEVAARMQRVLHIADGRLSELPISGVRHGMTR